MARRGLRGRYGCAVDGDGAADRAVRAVDRFEDFGAASAHQPGQPDDFASAHLEIDAVQRTVAGIRLRDEGQIADFEHDFAGGALFWGAREQFAKWTADHQRDEFAPGGLGHRPVADVGAVAQHGHRIGDLFEFLQAVRDVDDADVLCGEVADDPEQPVHLGIGERRGGFVHDQDAQVQVERLGHLDELLLGDAAVADQRGRRQAQPELVEQRSGAGVHGLAVEGAARVAQFRAEEHVVRNGQFGDQVEFLVDHGDAVPRGVLGRVDVHRLAEDLDAALVVGVHAGQDVAQRRLAGAVLAEQRDDLTGVHGEVDAVQGAHAGEGLADLAHGQQDRSPGRASPSRCASLSVRDELALRQQPVGRRRPGWCARGRGQGDGEGRVARRSAMPVVGTCRRATGGTGCSAAAPSCASCCPFTETATDW